MRNEIRRLADDRELRDCSWGRLQKDAGGGMFQKWPPGAQRTSARSTRHQPLPRDEGKWVPFKKVAGEPARVQGRVKESGQVSGGLQVQMRARGHSGCPSQTAAQGTGFLYRVPVP